MAVQWHIDKLGDEYGQYTLVATCRQCGHELHTTPHLLGQRCGWDAKLEDIAKRMRCSACGVRGCAVRTYPPKKPRGYTSLPK